MRIAIVVLVMLVFPAGGRAAQPEVKGMLSHDKTLVAWVAPANLTQRPCGGPLTLDNLSGNFDGIIFGELSPKKWMAGSDWFRRTERNQKDWPVETADAKTFVQIAITYKGQQITIYRNGKQYAQYETKGKPLEFGVGGLVVIGRHVFDPAGPHFAAQIDDVRIYDVALSAKQVAALKPNKPSAPKPWAWWSFEKDTKELTGRFETMTFGEPQVKDGKLVLDGKDDALVGIRGAAYIGPLKPPPAPKEYANVFSVGYGTVDHFPTDKAKFEKLLVNLKNAGYNTVHCVYTDWRLELFRKHKMKMMIDVLAWKETAEIDVRRAKQQEAVFEICKKVRGDDAVWGYNLWNERLDRYSPGNLGSLNGLILVLRKWDPTHPVWVGTYLNFLVGHIKYNPGCIAYYDYHWQRGLGWHFKMLNTYKPLMEKRGAYLGRWMLRTNYNQCMYTLNTSLAYGLKTGIWFICGPWHPATRKWDDKHFLCAIGRDMHKLWPEIGKIGRPLEVYSTPTTKSVVNTPKKKGLPTGKAIPEDFWFQVKSGEALIGHFKYDDKRDALYVANHNAHGPQKMVIELKGRRVKAELFDRKTGKWKELEAKGGAVAFVLQPAGGELLRISGR